MAQLAVTAPDAVTVLKHDLFGTVRHRATPGGPGLVERDTTTAARALGWLARRLAAREARAMQALRGQAHVPRLVHWDGRLLQRTWIAGVPLHRSGGVDRAYFRAALRLLRQLHAAGVVHNDLAKEPNWLVTPDGQPALVDFQLAMRPRRRGRLFRMLAHDDLRHLLKHKRRYCPEHLTAREKSILARRSPVSELWARGGKPAYQLVTRRLLGWADREGAGDRGGR